MGKGDKQELFDISKGKVGQAETEYTKKTGELTEKGDTTWGRASDDYANTAKGYGDYASGPGVSKEDEDRMRSAYANIPGAGNNKFVNPLAGQSSAFSSAYRPDYSEADTGFRKLAGEGGGFDKGQLDKIYGNVDTLTGLGKTGGITDEDKANINRESILEQEKTGGYSDQDRALIRAKSAASSPAYFSALKDNLERQRGVTGNLANAGAVDFKLARQSAQQQGQDRMAAEAGLQEAIRSGKMQAGQYLSGQNMQLAGLRTANQLQGAGAAGNLGLNTQQAITQNQQQGLRGLQESQTGLGQWGLGQAGGLDQFEQAKGQFDVYGQKMGQDAALQQAEQERWLTEQKDKNRQYGITGQNDLYKTNLDATYNFGNQALNMINNKYDTQGMMLGLATQNRGATAMENASAVAGMVGAGLGAATGVGGLAGLAGGAASKALGPVNTSGYQFPTSNLTQYGPEAIGKRPL
jgi:hypothetical protein